MKVLDQEGLLVNTGSGGTNKVAQFKNTVGAVATYICSGSPNSSITGSVGDKALDITNGLIYFKSSGSATDTGWVVIPDKNFTTFGGEEVHSADYADLSAIVTALGSSNKKVVKVNGSVSVAGTVTVPTNLIFRFTGDGKFVKGASGKIIFQGVGVEAHLTRQIFSGFSPSDITFTGQYPIEVSPVWWGATGDGSTDDLSAFKCSIECFAATYYGQNPSVIKSASRIKIPIPKVYYRISDTWQIVRPVEIDGGGGFGWYSGAMISPDAGKTALYIHRYETTGNGGYSGTAATADWCKIKGLALKSTYKSDDTTFTLNSGLTLTRTAGAGLTKIARNYGVRVNGWTYIVDSISTNTITFIKPRIYISVTYGSNIVTFQGGLGNLPVTGGTGDWTGRTIVIDGQYSFTISSHTSSQITLSANYTGRKTTGNDFYGTASIGTGGSVVTGLAGTALDAHGIDAKTPCMIQDVYSSVFSGNGFNFDSFIDVYASGAPSKNSNNSRLDRIMSYDCQGHGLMLSGYDSNNCLINSGDFTRNYGAGVMLGAFLGNTLSSCHTSFNLYGSYTNPQVELDAGGSDNQANLLIGCYCEGGQSSNILGQYDTYIGGDDGASEDRSSKSHYAGFQSGYFTTNAFRVLREYAVSGKPTVTYALGYNSENTGFTQLLEWGTSDEPLQAGYGGTTQNPYPLHRFIYLDSAYGGYQGWYLHIYNNSTTTAAYGISGGACNKGGGKFWLPSGTFIGGSLDHKIQSDGTNVNFTLNDGTTFSGIKSSKITFAGSTSGSVALQAASTGSGVTFTLPQSTGSSGQVLTTDGSGNLSWGAAGSVSSTGSSGNIPLFTPNGSTLANSLIWQSGTSAGSDIYVKGYLKFDTDATYSLGALGSGRPTNIYASSVISSPSITTQYSASAFGYMKVTAGDASNVGMIEWYHPDASRMAYMGYGSSNSTLDLNLYTTNSVKFRVVGGDTHLQNLKFITDATYDIGASGANRARDLYISRTGYVGTSLTVGGTDLVTPFLGIAAFKVKSSSNEFTVMDDSAGAFTGLTNGTVTVYSGSISSPSNIGIIGTYTNHQLSIRTSSTERINITNGGLVGINTTASGTQLSVLASSTGTIGLKVNNPTSTTADVIKAQINGADQFNVDSKGNTVIGAQAALASSATDGFLYVPSTTNSMGTPTAYTGKVPLYVNTSSSAIYGYIGGTWTSLSSAGGSGTVNSGVSGKVAYYPSSATTVDDFAPIDLGGTNATMKITAAANGDVPLTILGAAAPTANLLAIGLNGSANKIIVDSSGNLLVGNNTGLRVADTDASHYLIIKPGSNITANRTLTVTTGDSDSTLTLSADATISGTNTGDQTITLSNDLSGSGTGTISATIANNAVTFAKMQNIATNSLLGRSTASTGNVEQITVGSNLTLSSGTLSANANVATGTVSGTSGTLPIWESSTTLRRSLIRQLAYTSGSDILVDGYFKFESDNTYSIGDTTNRRPSNIYVAGTVIGPTITGGDSSATHGTVSLKTGGVSNTGFIEFNHPSAGRLGYIGYGTQTTHLDYNTDGTVIHRFNYGGSEKALIGSTGLIVGNTGLNVKDTDASHVLTFAPGSNLTANRTLTITTGDSDRTLTLSGNATISGTNTGDQTITLSGDVSGSGTGAITTAIGSNKVTNAMLATVSTATFKGRITASTGNVEDLTVTQATSLLNAFVGDSGSGGTKGLVPAPATGDSSKFLKGDGTWATVSGSGDVSSNTSSSVDSEVALFSGTGGKTIKRATGTGVATLASGVLGTATIGSSLSYSGGTLDAIQAITTSSTPQFARVGYGAAADSLTPVKITGPNASSSADGSVLGESITFNTSKGADGLTKTWAGLQIKPTFNNSGNTGSLTVDILQIDSVNTSLTNTTVNLIDAMFGGVSKFTVDSTGAITAGSIAYSAITSKNIVNADVNSSAAIAYTKLNLAGSIVNADISTSAAIAYSKLNLTGAILNADLAGSISDTKLSTISTAGKVSDSALSSNVALYNSTTSFTASQTITKTSLGTTSTSGLELSNTTAAAAGAQQISPALTLTGQGWKTNSTAASQAVNFRLETVPVQGAANPSATLSFKNQINGGGYSEIASLTSGGTFTATLFSGSGASLTNIPNSALTNSSITVTAGTGMSGGGSVSLGSSVTLNNAGVTSITGTSNQVNASASTGSVTLSLPQSINTTATPQFLRLGLGAAADSLTPLLISGSSYSSSADGSVLGQSISFTTTKGADGLTKTWAGLQIKPTINNSGNTGTLTLDILQIDTVNTNVTNTNINLIDAMYGGVSKFTVDSTGAIVTGSIPYSAISSKNIVNADVNSSAAIAYSKLNLATSIVNADISTSAAIEYSKLNLSGSIVNTDIASGAAIVDTKLATISTAGKVSDSALSSNVALYNGTTSFTASQTITKTGLGTTSTNGLELTNTTAAANNTQQISPALTLTGQGWKTNATAASQAVNFRLETVPVQGAANPTATLSFKNQINAGGYSEVASLTSGGTFTATLFSGSGASLTSLNASNLSSGTVPAAQMPALTGDVTTSSGAVSTTIASSVVSNSKLATMANNTIKGNNSGSTANPSDLSASAVTAMLSAFVGDSGSGGTKGLVPAPATGDATKYLKGDGTWGAVSGGSPAGSSGNLQYNAAGSLGAVSNTAVSAGQIQLGSGNNTQDTPLLFSMSSSGMSNNTSRDSHILEFDSAYKTTVAQNSNWRMWVDADYTVTGSYFKLQSNNASAGWFDRISLQNTGDMTLSGTLLTTSYLYVGGDSSSPSTINHKITGTATSTQKTITLPDVTGTVVTSANPQDFLAGTNAQTGTTYTLTSSDNQKIVTCSNASAITVTVPSSLSVGFSCTIIQLGAGQVTISAGASMTKQNRNSYTKTAGQYAAATVVVYASGNFLIQGDLA